MIKHKTSPTPRHHLDINKNLISVPQLLLCY